MPRPFNRIKKMAKLAQIDSFIENELPEGYQTIVGERGIKLSGGQIQRIGIARALYIKPSLLILDEATNAIDDSTEKKIFSNLDTLKRKFTSIMVAHRKSSLVLCDKIYEIKHQNLNLI